MRDADDEIVLVDHRVAVAVFGRDVHLDRHARPLLDCVAADKAGVIRRAAGDDDDPAQPAQEVVGDAAEVAEIDDITVHAVGDRFGHRIRLLVDLLEHEGLETALLGGVVVPVDLADLARDRLAGNGIEELRTFRADHDQLVVADDADVARVLQERGNRRGDEGLPVTDADDQRALLARADQNTRLVGVHRDEGVVTTQLGVRAADGLDQVPVVAARDQVRDHLGVRLRREHRALGLELLAQRGEVLDDPVEGDVDAVVVVAVRMGVRLGDPAVRRPASVADPGRGL